jgi:hypothetical protein
MNEEITCTPFGMKYVAHYLECDRHFEGGVARGVESHRLSVSIHMPLSCTLIIRHRLLVVEPGFFLVVNFPHLMTKKQCPE